MTAVGGWAHLVFLDPDGAVWTVGCNDDGQLGLGHSKHQNMITRVANLPRIVGLASGSNHVACVCEEGRLFVWGYGPHGQLGQGNTSNLRSPTQVAGLPPVQSVACGCNFTVCVGRDSSVWVFGYNSHGQLGVGHTNNVLKPTFISIKASLVACGYAHTMIVDLEGQLFACGYGLEGQLGTGNTSNCHNFTLVAGAPRPKTLHCGECFTFLVDTNNHLWSTGDNSDGYLGLGDNNNRTSFSLVPDVQVGHLSCGWRHVMCMDTHSNLWGWGRNSHGQLPCGNTNTPVKLQEGVAVVRTGYFVTILRTTDDKVFVTGCNENGQLSMGHTTNLATFTPNPNIPAEWIKGPLPERPSPSLIQWAEYRSCMALSALEEQQLAEIDMHAQEAHHREPEWVPSAPLSLGSWQRCVDLLDNKKQEYMEGMVDRQQHHKQQLEDIKHTQESIIHLREQLCEQEAKLAHLQEAEKSSQQDRCGDEERVQHMDTLMETCKALSHAEAQRHSELAALLREKPLGTLGAHEMSLVWWRMNLSEFSQEAMEAGIGGEMMLEMDRGDWLGLGLSRVSTGRILFMAPILALPEGLSILGHLDEENCAVCTNKTAGTTINLLKERNIKIAPTTIVEEGWITPYLLYEPVSKDQFANKEEYHAAVLGMKKLRREHKSHLKELRSKGLLS